jgi:hypothetical protein
VVSRLTMGKAKSDSKGFFGKLLCSRAQEKTRTWQSLYIPSEGVCDSSTGPGGIPTPDRIRGSSQKENNNLHPKAVRMSHAETDITRYKNATKLLIDKMRHQSTCLDTNVQRVDRKRSGRPPGS